MSEPERPRPEYGEYASDDEYAAALARSGAEPVRSPHPVLQVHRESQRPTASERSTAVSTRRAFDRIATVFFLAFGAVSILGSAANFMNFRQSLPEMVTQLGMGEFHSTEQTAMMGIVMLASQVLLWAAAAVWSFRRIKRLKLAWWVPILVGAISFILLSILLGSVLAADPTFIPTLSKP